MKTQFVVQPVKPLVEFETSAEAIKFSKDIHNSPEVSSIVSKLAGTSISRLAHRCKHEAVVEFDHRFHFLISCNPHGIAWTLSDTLLETGVEDEARQIELDFGGAPGVYIWNLKKIKEKLIGQTFDKFIKSELGLLMYVNGITPLLFSPLRITNSSDPNDMMLFWDFAE